MIFKLISMYIVIFSMIGCSVNKGKDGLPGLKTDDCYKERKTVSTVVDQEAKLSLIGETWVMILVNDDTQRYGACNMVEYTFAEGDKVIFSADVKETMPNERWAFIPCVLKKLDQVK